MDDQQKDIQTAQDPQNLTELEQKHVPQITVDESFVRVQIGQKHHPMEQEHYIEWVELYAENELAGRRDFSPGQEPQARFNKPAGRAVSFRAVISCNVHGLWQNEIKL